MNGLAATAGIGFAVLFLVVLVAVVAGFGAVRRVLAERARRREWDDIARLHRARDITSAPRQRTHHLGRF